MAARRRLDLLPAGSPIPAFRLRSLDSGESGLRDLVTDGPALLVFFKVTCPVCQLALPYLERIHQSGGLRIYGISQNGPEDTREFNLEFGVTFPTLLDAEDDGFPASNAFGISSVPTLFYVAQNGAVSRVIEGWQKKEIQWLGTQAGMNPFRQGDNVPEWKAG